MLPRHDHFICDDGVTNNKKDREAALCMQLLSFSITNRKTNNPLLPLSLKQGSERSCRAFLLTYFTKLLVLSGFISNCRKRNSWFISVSVVP